MCQTANAYSPPAVRLDVGSVAKFGAGSKGRFFSAQAPPSIPSFGNIVNSEKPRVSWTMRLRVAEILRQRGMTAYALARSSGGRISRSVAYRLIQGNKQSIRLAELEALCDVLGVGPAELFERDLSRRARR
jgi:DNA-binding Xre family transcriptional regulator